MTDKKVWDIYFGIASKYSKLPSFIQQQLVYSQSKKELINFFDNAFYQKMNDIYLQSNAQQKVYREEINEITDSLKELTYRHSYFSLIKTIKRIKQYDVTCSLVRKSLTMNMQSSLQNKDILINEVILGDKLHLAHVPELNIVQKSSYAICWPDILSMQTLMRNHIQSEIFSMVILYKYPQKKSKLGHCHINTVVLGKRILLRQSYSILVQ